MSVLLQRDLEASNCHTPHTSEEILRSYFHPSLPKVRLEPLELGVDDTHMLGLDDLDKYTVMTQRGREIGEVWLAHALPFDNEPAVYVANVRRHDMQTRHQSRDGMLAAYLALASYAECSGETLRCGTKLTKHSKKLWEIMIGAGVAEVITPFQAETQDGDPFYIGLAVMKTSAQLLRGQ